MPKTRDVMNLDVLLSRAVDLGASDIHLKLGRPPMLRRGGSLGPSEGPELTRADPEGVLPRLTESPPPPLKGFGPARPPDTAPPSGQPPPLRLHRFLPR